MSGNLARLTSLSQAGGAGADYLARSVRSNGRFKYLVDPVSGRSEPGYNLLRHAGALLALGVWTRTSPSAEASRAISRSADYLLERVRKVGPGGLPCLVSKGRAKLGGSALLLLALLEPAAAPRSDFDRDLGEGLADYLISQQDRSGAFRSVRRLDGGARASFDSSYYPGQAVLALLRFHEAAASPRHLRAALAGAHHLVASEPRPLPQVDAADHWLIMALDEAHRFENRPEFAARALAGGERILRLVLTSAAGEDRHVLDPDYGCGPAATRGEALAAAARLARRIGERAVASRFQQGLSGITAFCLEHQWRQGEAPHGEASACRGGFSRSRTDRRIRIDTVQHSILAIHGLVELLATPDSSPSAGQQGHDPHGA
jgi:hypothetical protein